MSDELGDSLDALARASQGGGQSQPRRAATPAPSNAVSDEDGYITAEVDHEEAHSPSPAAPAFHQPSPAVAPRYTPPRKAKKSSELKAIAAPILLTVGMLLLVPACWAVLVLTGAGVPMSDREDSSTMAKVMLLCWPLALTLILPAIFIFAQLAKEKKQR